MGFARCSLSLFGRGFQPLPKRSDDRLRRLGCIPNVSEGGGNPFRTGIILLFFFLLLPRTSDAAPAVADVSSRAIEITSKFKGTELWLFGARQDAGDLIFVVRGPKQSYRVSKKKRVAGIWVNSNPARFHGVYGYYLVGASKDLSLFDERKLAETLDVELPGTFEDGMSALLPQHSAEYHAPLVQAQIDRGVYSPELHPVRFIGDTLFKAALPFSENLPRGVYTAEIYLVAGDELQSAQTIPITVEKKGFDAFLYELAYNHAWIYGLVSLAMALGLGWTGGQFFRRA
jgi:uncharacterized protein (TIGR02186 family)